MHRGDEKTESLGKENDIAVISRRKGKNMVRRVDQRNPARRAAIFCGDVCAHFCVSAKAGGCSDVCRARISRAGFACDPCADD
jgi:hypothetical protein